MKANQTIMTTASRAIFVIHLLQLLLFFGFADSLDANKVACPPQDVILRMSGLAAGNRLLGAWQKEYTNKYCPGFNISFELSSWDAAGARVCASSLIHVPVDLAGMTGSFFPSQASTIDGWSYQCKRSQLGRETTAVLAGYRGLVVGVSRDGAAAQCLELLGDGLSKDQLRWMYSSYTVKELISYGWDPSSVPYLDNDDNTHLWSELHENCTDEEIILAVEEVGEGNADALDYLFEHIVRSPGESLRQHFSNASSPQQLTTYMQAHGGAIAIFHLYDTLTKEFQDRGVLHVGIMDDGGKVIMPSAMTFESELYPFLKKITIGLVRDTTALQATRPFLEFGYSTEGMTILQQLGYWPIEEWKRHSMFSRLDSELGFRAKEIQEYCKSQSTEKDNALELEIGGGDTVLPIMRAWKDLYNIGCPINIRLQGGGSSDGARFICSSSDAGAYVDVGMMSRNFNPVTEAVPRATTPYVYDCLGDESISAIQIEVGLDGIGIVFAIGSEGEKCVRRMGGLTIDQLRWMYSSYSDAELEKSGWDPRSLRNSDFDTNTHLWSELDPRCADEEIELVGDKRGEGIFLGFVEMVLLDFANGETVAADRPSSYVEAYGADALQYLLVGHNGAVAFGGYHFYTAHKDVFWSAPLAHRAIGPYVEPSETSIGDHSYPLTRSMLLVVRNKEDVLKKVIPFVTFGYDHQELLRSTGYAPVDNDRAKEMIRRLNNGPYAMSSTDTDDNEQDKSYIGLIVGILLACAVIVALVIIGIKYFRQ